MLSEIFAIKDLLRSNPDLENASEIYTTVIFRSKKKNVSVKWIGDHKDLFELERSYRCFMCISYDEGVAKHIVESIACSLPDEVKEANQVK